MAAINRRGFIASLLASAAVAPMVSKPLYSFADVTPFAEMDVAGIEQRAVAWAITHRSLNSDGSISPGFKALYAHEIDTVFGPSDLEKAAADGTHHPNRWNRLTFFQ